MDVSCACGATLQPPESAVGKKVRCPECQAADAGPLKRVWTALCMSLHLGPLMLLFKEVSGRTFATAAQIPFFSDSRCRLGNVSITFKTE